MGCVICGDNLEVMARMPDNSVDTIITDPPYGLEFMGKEWDKLTRNLMNPTSKADQIRKADYGKNYAGRRSNLPDYATIDQSAMQQWHYKWATEALRIAKPGAMMLIFGGTRTYHRLACAIEDAGWQIRDCMMWLYGSGFPKSCSISQQFDRQACRKKLEKELGRKPTKEEFKKAWEGFREITGTRISAFGDTEQSETKDGRNLWAKPATKEVELRNKPTTPFAKLWDGWGTALKPSWEPILVCMKPLDGTFAQNAEKWGVAGLDIDGGRIDYVSNYDRKHQADIQKGEGTFFGGKGKTLSSGNLQGRWPANLILDEEVAVMLDEQSGDKKSTPFKMKRKNDPNANVQFMVSQKYNPDGGYSDSGGASRFFYCPKASRAERNAGLEGMEAKPMTLTTGKGRTWNDRCGNCGKKFIGPDNTICHCDNPITDKTVYKQQNNHPTVKPLKLMEYLCNLTKIPTGGVVLDPFGGSGTTAMACINTGRDYILIEKEKLYCEIAEKRIMWAKKQKDNDDKNNTGLLF